MLVLRRLMWDVIYALISPRPLCALGTTSEAAVLAAIENNQEVIVQADGEVHARDVNADTVSGFILDLLLIAVVEEYEDADDYESEIAPQRKLVHRALDHGYNVYVFSDGCGMYVPQRVKESPSALQIMYDFLEGVKFTKGHVA